MHTKCIAVYPFDYGLSTVYEVYLTVEGRMVEQTFEMLVEGERERLKKKRSDMVDQIKSLEKELGGIDREMEAVNAYYAAKTGKRASTGTRAPRGSRRKEILDLVKNGRGMNRAEILEALGVKGDKSGEQSVSNALSALKKGGELVVEDGKYIAGVKRG